MAHFAQAAVFAAQPIFPSSPRRLSECLCQGEIVTFARNPHLFTALFYSEAPAYRLDSEQRD